MNNTKTRTKRTLTGVLLIVLALLAVGGLAGNAAALTKSGSASTAPWIESDKADYAPGALVTLNGANWQAGETVHININDDQGQTWGRSVDVVADANGGIVDHFNLPDWFVATYTVTATGPSGTATTSFTDANANVSPTRVPAAGAQSVSAGTTFDFTVAYTKNGGGNDPELKTPIVVTNPGGTCGGTGTQIPASWISALSPTLPTAITSTATSFTYRVTVPAGQAGGTYTGQVVPTVTAGTGGASSFDLCLSVPAGKANQTITFVQPTSPAAYNSSFTVSPTASSGLTVDVAASGVCSILGNTVTMTSGTGTCTLTASQPGNASFNAAPDVVRTVTASKLNQTISFGALDAKTFGDPDFSISATATSDLGVSFSALGDCNFNGLGQVHITGAGSCSITASQAGDANYNAATAVLQSFTIAQAPQTISFTAPSGVTFGDPDVTLGGTASSGLPVSYSSSTLSTCTIVADKLHVVGAGLCTITATQAGNANWLAATPVADSTTIAKKAQTITFAALGDKKLGDPDFTVSATGGDSGNPVTFASSSSSSICTVSGATVHIVGVGTCAVTASQAGNDNYSAATPVTRSFTVTYVWNGFLQPINDTAHTGLYESKFKLGQTIPAKFVLKNAQGTVVQQVGNPTFSRSGRLGNCDTTAILDPITEVITPDAGVVYAWDGNQYHYNWSTKGQGLTPGEYRIYANLADGTKNSVDICLT